MPKPRRVLLQLMLIGVCLQPCAHAADEYPQRTIRLIVPFVAGGAGDIIARLIGNGLTKGLGQQIVIDNRGGGGSVVGTELAARASPDGYTLVLVASAHALNPGLLGKLPFDPINDFAPITLAVETPLIVVVPVSFAATNIREFVELAKAQPNRIAYGSAGQGTAGHLATELLSLKTGIRLVHVPYKGAGQALIDLMGAPAIINKLHLAATQVLRSPLVAEQLLAQGAEPIAGTPAELRKFLENEIAVWTGVIRQANVRPAN
jgi:tripartite-type tricarboxylate transporter receptor subunit TctC